MVYDVKEVPKGFHIHANGGGLVQDTAVVEASVYVDGNARVSGDAQVYGNALVYGNAWVSGNALVYGDAWVSGNARVRGDAWETTPLYIAGMKHSLSNSRHGHILIGCHEHTFAYWLDHYKAIGRAEGYSEEEIKQYGLFIELFVRVGK